MNISQNNAAHQTSDRQNNLKISYAPEIKKQFFVEPDWTKILQNQPILKILRPDYYLIYKYDPFEIVYQQNVRLDLGVGNVSLHLISKYSKTSDLEHIRKFDLVIEQFSSECHIQPFDFICKVMCNIECPNEALKRIMRTTFVAQSDRNGMPEYGVMCFHDISVMVNSVKPFNYDITFTPDKNELCHEAYRRIRKILPKTIPVTKREREVIQFLDEGLSSKEIGSRLFISKTTVDTHRQRMLHKWNLSNTAALLKKAKDENWI